ncbi:MAG: hypothetical protein HZC12_09030 [Nitrospirae bacterium]|nr:hypothetical protein [Nitrospirota bacterium]
MLTGFNNNITYKDKVYHIQTEDGGIKNPVITTLLYYKGAVIASKKTDYTDLLGKEGHKKTIREMMERQHKIMIKALLTGKFDTHTSSGRSDTGATTNNPPKKKPIRKSLDDVLLDYISEGEDK